MNAKAIGFWLALLLLGYSPVCAADIKVAPGFNGTPAVIKLSGELLEGDDQKFIALSLPLDSAIVPMNSPGGKLAAGLGIGRAIRLKEFITFAAKDADCQSACALIWLSGARRFMERGARLGFHAAYRTEGNNAVESGQGNAILGAYLNQLGLTQSAVAFVTEASPTEMKYLTPEIVKELGIDVTLLEPEENVAGDPRLGIENTSSVLPPLEKIDKADIFGFDMPGEPLRSVSLNECDQACAREGDCKAFTFIQ